MSQDNLPCLLVRECFCKTLEGQQCLFSMAVHNVIVPMCAVVSDRDNHAASHGRENDKFRDSKLNIIDTTEP